MLELEAQAAAIDAKLTGNPDRFRQRPLTESQALIRL
ncbi:MAG: hypothetical protein RLZZ450_2220 [Pseudomonadota bacterium]|jgi:hypothetical protein